MVVFLIGSHFLCLNGSDALPNLRGVVLHHCVALAGNGSDQVIASTSLQMLTDSVVTPTVNIVARWRTFLTAAIALM